LEEEDNLYNNKEDIPPNNKDIANNNNKDIPHNNKVGDKFPDNNYKATPNIQINKI